MKRIVNSTTKHMARVGHLITMDKFYEEIDHAESNMLPQISEKNSESDKTDAVEESEADNLEVIEIDDEINIDNDDDNNENNDAQDNDRYKDKSEQLNEKWNVEQISPSEKYGFLLKRQPSFLKFIIKKHWQQPLLPNIPESRKYINIDDGKERNEPITSTKKKKNTNVIKKKRSSKKLKKIKSMKYRHDFFMKPIKTKVTAYKWTKLKAQRNKGAKKKKEKSDNREKSVPIDPHIPVNVKQVHTVNERHTNDHVDTLVQIYENSDENGQTVSQNNGNRTVNVEHQTSQINESLVGDEENVSQLSERGNNIDIPIKVDGFKSDSEAIIREETDKDMTEKTVNVVPININSSNVTDQIVSIENELTMSTDYSTGNVNDVKYELTYEDYI
ncbi:hypothetical protein ACF0H5_020527 [Mactra antiquata]